MQIKAKTFYFFRSRTGHQVKSIEINFNDLIGLSFA